MGYLWNKKSFKKVNKYKMTEKELYKRFTNLSETELNTKNNLKTYVKNDVMTTVEEHVFLLYMTM